MRIRKLATVPDRIFTAVSITALGAMAAYIVVNIVSRLVFGRPVPNVTELTTNWGMILAVFFGLGRTTLRREHITVDVLSGLSGRWSSTGLDVVNRGVAGLVLIAIAFPSFSFALRQIEAGERGIVSGWPVWPTRLVVPVLLAYAGLVFLSQSIAALRAKRRREAPRPERDSD